MGDKKLDWSKSLPGGRTGRAETEKHVFLTGREDKNTVLTTFRKDPKASLGRVKEGTSTHRREKDARREARRQSKY